jgi:aryl-alcohol dehydrogenase-like predicted oxidoreductase
MERTEIPGTSLKVSPVAIGTWAIGGWMWGRTDEAESITTIQAAFERGMNVVDTAPVYGFGRSEEIVGRAIAESRLRSHVIIATKVGLQWEGGRVTRNASRARIMREVEDSLRRLQTDYIDIYQVHWPDPPQCGRERRATSEPGVCAVPETNSEGLTMWMAAKELMAPWIIFKPIIVKISSA